ncbi:MAG: LytR/AlgR family response regulator transcription factor [Alloprevotella sp.]
MNEKKGLIVFIVDDNSAALECLAADLRQFEQVSDVYTYGNYVEATLPMLEIHPDVLFLDVEVPGKSGLEFLQSVRQHINFSFKVVFYSAYSDYMLDAIRQSAFDFLLKPYKQSELRTVVERLAEAKTSREHIQPAANLNGPRKLAIQTVSELLFITTQQILQFNYNSLQRSWQLMLTDCTTYTLKRGTSASDLLELSPSLVRISNTCIINLTYLSAVENNTQRCRLAPPFEHLEIIASRRYFSKLKEQFEML